MLLEFTVENFASFKERTTFSMLPASIREKRQVQPTKIQGYKNLAALPTAVIYGPNNSGKSNLFRALKGLQHLVTESGSFNSDKKLRPYEPFSLNLSCQNAPVRFEIDFIASGTRYLFSLAFQEDRILEEKLSSYHLNPSGITSQRKIYHREAHQTNGDFTPVNLGGNKKFPVGPNQLVLSKGDIAQNETLKQVYAFFAKGHLSVVTLAETLYIDFLNTKYKGWAEQPKNLRIKTLIDKILQQADPSIQGLRIGLVDTSKLQLPESIPDHLKAQLLDQLSKEIFVTYPLYEGETNTSQTVDLPLAKQSTGTRKLLAILPEVLPILEQGGVLMMDELNTSLHTEITTFIIDLFNNPKTNPNQAQLILTAHDILLLNRNLYDRDQIYITEKDERGVSKLSAFSDFDFSNLRSPNLAKYYEEGRLGGMPNLFTPYLHDLIATYLNDSPHAKQTSFVQKEA